MSVFNFKPARPTAESDIISDLDALIEKPIGFTFQGKTHVINPITTATFFKVANALSAMDALKNKGDYSKDDLVGVYLGVFSSVCDTIGRKEIESMTQAQAGALLQIILDCVVGKAQVERASVENTEKKKTRTTHKQNKLAE